jgi:transcriptional regulator with XRE-family HTH domain
MTTAVTRIIEELRSRGGLKETDVANIASVSPATVARWIAGKARPDPQTQLVISDLRYVVDRLSEFFAPDETRLWLYSKHRLLNGEPRRIVTTTGTARARGHPSRRRARCAAPLDDGRDYWALSRIGRDESCSRHESIIASEAKQSGAAREELDCFVAALLAMTAYSSPRFPSSRYAQHPSRASATVVSTPTSCLAAVPSSSASSRLPNSSTSYTVCVPW